ncbi:hypothetical protein ACTJLD_21555 [Burkholderia sp. 22088]|uniref:hypothetical protein n=1 Tax=Burkholderia sp. 22088 TaxID=3453871 RepID=UPI003F87C5E2
MNDRTNPEENKIAAMAAAAPADERAAFEQLKNWPKMAPREAFYAGWQAARVAASPAAVAVAYIAKADLNRIQKDRTFHVSVIGVKEGRFNTALFAAPQPAQADATVDARPDPACAAIQFALSLDDGSSIDFLNNWNEGEFDVLRREWPEAPEDVYIGADPLHPGPPRALAGAE